MNTTRPGFRPRTKLAMGGVALIAAMLLSGCFVLVQNETFAIGTETNRANLVVYRDPSRFIEVNVIHTSGVTNARNVVIDHTPDRIDVPHSVRALACAMGATSCVAVHLFPSVVRSQWVSDVRGRGDFHGAMYEAASGGRCFAWTFVAASGRNFTTKPVGNSGCR